MFIYFLQISIVMAAFITLLIYKAKNKTKAIKIPRNYNDTSGARYAINEKGFLEEIHKDKLSSHTS